MFQNLQIISESHGPVPWLNRYYWTQASRGSMIAHRYWWLAFAGFITYLPIIWILQFYMKNRPPMKLKWSPFTWNVTLSLLSLLGGLLMLYEAPHIVKHAIVAEDVYGPYTRAVTAIFALTKGIEFGDTIFLILRKRPVIFLHWYHHVSVAVYSWHALYVSIPFAHNCAFINLWIHAVMYMYYAIGVLIPRHPILRRLRPYITISQTLQMFVGMFLSWRAIGSPLLDSAQSFSAWMCLIMYTSYAYLFAAFCIQNYVQGIRVGISLSIGTLHIIAAVGLSMLWKHPNWAALTAELFTGYVITALLLWATKSSSQFSPVTSFTPYLKSENKKFLVTSKHSTGKSIIDSVGRVGLMLLNCTCVWAREQQQMQRRHEAAKELQVEQSSQVLSNAKTSPTAKVPYQENSSNNLVYALLQQKPSMSDLRSTIGGIDTEHPVAPQLQSHFFKLPPADSWLGCIVALGWDAHPIEKWLTVMCLLVPAIYGWKMYGDLFLGFCIHGCLRWVLELHTTGTLVEDLDVEKLDSTTSKND